MRNNYSNQQQTTFHVAEPNSLGLALQVRGLLPKLAKKAEHWTKSTVCPNCGDIKDRAAKTCRPCFKKRKDFAKLNNKRVYIPRPAEFVPQATQHGLGHGHYHEGIARPQPKRPRMVKQADGTWAEEIE